MHADHGDLRRRGAPRSAIVCGGCRFERHAAAAADRGRAAGAFFSGGVDSTYTVLRNHDRYPPGDARRIQYLVLGHGLDVSLDDHGAVHRVLATA